MWENHNGFFQGEKEEMIIIVGLGNPTEEYAKTFHNMGYMAIDALADKLGKKIKKAECDSLTVTFSRNGEKVVLAKPLTYMNLSGKAVKSLIAKYKATPEEVVILYDDIDIDRYTLRARASGSAGTHNGMRDIISTLGTTGVKRVRIGIGREGYDLKDYVLSNIKSEDEGEFKKVFDKLADALNAYLKNADFEALMRAIN